MSYTPATKINLIMEQTFYDACECISTCDDEPIDWNNLIIDVDWQMLADEWRKEIDQIKADRLLEDSNALDEILVSTPIGYFWMR
jgi:hypothetical protein